ncbi:MAG: nuclease (SNase domain protein) [Acidimicrobiales bacterium]|nr:nuclease (SNase domain protein) [Acidimicrobiales bacterium]
MGRRARAVGITIITALAAVIALTGCGASAPRSPTTSASGAATIDRVVDGDTVIVRLSGRRERVRLIGIDTPESVKPNTPVQCYGLESSRRTHDLLPVGTAVRLVGDIEARDRYQRLLAYVYRSGDGLFVNLVLVRDGFARPYPFRPNLAHEAEIARAADGARAAGLGLWSHCR